MKAKPQARKNNNAPPSGTTLRAFMVGLVCGIIGTALAINIDWRELLKPSVKVESSHTDEPPRPKFEFYTLLPESNLSERPTQRQQQAIAADPGQRIDYFIVQAGSFRNEADASRRRAELILLGLDPKIDQVTNQAGQWYRVFIGPLSERTEAERIKALTASENIETLILSRKAN
jgi:cell division protein FtsN